MPFVRKIVDDLVEKRLWPVALLLLVALVAVPVVFGGGGDAGPAAGDTPLTAAADPDGLQPAVVAEAAPVARQDRSGKLRDPFKDLHPATSTTSATATATSQAAKDLAKAVAQATGGSSSPAASSSSPASSSTATPSVPSTVTPATTGDTTTVTPSTATPAATARKVYAGAADVTFGPASRDASVKANIRRFALLPSEKRQYVIYMGTLTDFKTAVFLLANRVTADGDGTCRPKTGKCETLELQKGDRARITVTLPDGSKQHWTLAVKDVYAKEVKSASAAKARTSRAGRTVVQTARAIAHAVGVVTQADAFAWDAERRALRRQNPRSVLKAAQAARLKAAAQP